MKKIHKTPRIIYEYSGVFSCILDQIFKNIPEYSNYSDIKVGQITQKTTFLTENLSFLKIEKNITNSITIETKTLPAKIILNF